jgi:cysteinyl-tRNA synthetase
MRTQVSHMGHARNYLTSDVIRRVLEDYFGYNIHFVMNVTDVDDKIIVKSRRAQHLQRFRRSNPQPDQVSASH